MLTNNGAVSHQISILTGLPRDAFKAVCAHELGHAWISSNVPRGRQAKLHTDAAEGFCELCAWMLVNAEGSESQKNAILHNAYTRGQVHVFIDAEKQFGMSDVVDWMKCGEDPRLDPEKPGQVRNVEAHRAASAKPRIIAAAPATVAAAPETLVLKGVAWTPQKPMAIINGCTFAVNEENKVRLGTTNVAVRCLSIGERSAKVRLVGSGEEKELVLPKN